MATIELDDVNRIVLRKRHEGKVDPRDCGYIDCEDCMPKTPPWETLSVPPLRYRREMGGLITDSELPEIDPDRLLAEIQLISRGGVHHLTPEESAVALSQLATKVNQLVDGIACGGPLPALLTQPVRDRERIDRMRAEEAGYC